MVNLFTKKNIILIEVLTDTDNFDVQERVREFKMECMKVKITQEIKDKLEILWAASRYLEDGGYSEMIKLPYAEFLANMKEMADKVKLLRKEEHEICLSLGITEEQLKKTYRIQITDVDLELIVYFRENDNEK